MEVLQVSNNRLIGGKILKPVTAYEQPWTMANAYKLFVFFVSKVASLSRGCEPYILVFRGSRGIDFLHNEA